MLGNFDDYLLRFKFFDDCLFTCIDIHIFDIHTHVHTSGSLNVYSLWDISDCLVGCMCIQMLWWLYLKCLGDLENRSMCTWVLKCSYACVFLQSHYCLLSWSNGCIFSCFIDNMHTCVLALMITCSHVYMLTCSNVYMLWCSSSLMITCFNDH